MKVMPRLIIHFPLTHVQIVIHWILEKVKCQKGKV